MTIKVFNWSLSYTFERPIHQRMQRKCVMVSTKNNKHIVTLMIRNNMNSHCADTGRDISW